MSLGTPVKSERIALAHFHAILGRDLVAMEVDVLEDVEISALNISICRWLGGLDADLHGVRRGRVLAQAERGGQLGVPAFAADLVEIHTDYMRQSANCSNLVADELK